MSMTIDSDDLKQLARILKDESDGKALRKELAANLRKASEPARDAARTSILAMASGGLPHDGEPLREAIATRIVTQALLSGRRTGAKIKAKKLPVSIRGFELAPKRTNREKWRHPVFQRTTAAGVYIDVWVDQVGKPRWFDDAMRDNKDEWRRAVVEAMEHTARRIASRVRTTGV